MGATKDRQRSNSIIHTGNGTTIFEVVENVDEIKDIVYNRYIDNDSFVVFHFPEGDELFIRKNQITVFYKSE